MISKKNPAWLKNKKVAIVCDWLTTYGGAEKVVKNVIEIFPEATIFTSQYSEKQVKWFNGENVKTGWMNFLPANLRKFLGVFRNIYFSNLNLSDFDVVISVCCAESKGVKTNKNQLHISYLQGPPIQYYWGMYDDYVKNPGFGKLNFLVRFFFKLLVGPLRKKDFENSKKPDFLIANSTYSSNEIKKYYNRKSDIIFPPVEVEKFKLYSKKEDFYISTSRQVNWKRLDLAVEAFKATGKRLVLVGDGAEHSKLLKMAENFENIEFIDTISDSHELSKIVARSKGFIFPSLEPFGIAPIEALSCGTPVLAFKKGGSLDYIKDGENGIFFERQSVESLKKAIEKFEKTKFTASEVSKTAEEFSTKNFKNNFENFVKEKFDEKF